MELPTLPSDFGSVVSLLNSSPSQAELLRSIQPFKDYETKLRQIYAQEPQHDAVKVEHLVSVFENDQLTAKARNIDAESEIDKAKYLLPLEDSNRHKDDSPATVTSIKEFRTNFNLFSEQSLVDLDWSNVVAAGSSVVTPLLPVGTPHNESKRALRAYYHERLAPASDVDLFIYGLNEEQAVEKIKQIESCIRDSVLAETTTIRTKNAITIVSEYPTRHVQIVLRLYKSITEILTGFDVDCSCVAYDGKQVWASPRALAAFATQQNSIDLTRRSPSYENRLAKYARRGFEVSWPLLDRSRIDPTIYERTFNRVVGLARLLVLEKLPHPSDRDAFADKRRSERGRPDLPWNARYRHALPGNVKDAQPEDVPDWLEDVNHSDYHTFTIPYGPKYSAKKIEKLLFKQDLLLNAEWNRPKDRETKLHRHPAFFGSVEDVIQDCCGFCPDPVSDEDLKAHEEESKLYISGKLRFMKDDPGRQAIGSFNPLTADDWTDMAYLGSSPRLCQAIVDNDIEAVKDWFGEAGADVNRRDHTGRTPLQLACMCASPEIVQLLIDRGARIVPRIYNGMTALHMAAHRGDVEIVKLLLDKSESNGEEEDRKEEIRKEARRATRKTDVDVEMGQNEDEDIEMIENDEESDQDDAMTEGSFVKVKDEEKEDDEDDADVYDVDVLAWDNPVSPLHLAIIGGHIEVINVLIENYGADVMLPVKVKQQYQGPQAILNLVLPLQLKSEHRNETIRTLLAYGASPAQADTNQVTNLHYLVSEAKTEILDILNEKDQEVTRKIINHLTADGWGAQPTWDSPLFTAIRLGTPDVVRKVLELGANPEVDFESLVRAYTRRFENGEKDPDKLKRLHREGLEQPIMQLATRHRMVDIVSDLVDRGLDINILSRSAHNLVSNGVHQYNHQIGSLLDFVQERVKELEEYEGENSDNIVKPDPLPEFQEPQCGEYESWILRTENAEDQQLYQEQLKKHEDDVKQFSQRDTNVIHKKRSVIDEMLIKWRELQKKLIEKGAQTFASLHPDVEIPENNSRPWKRGPSGQKKDRPYENKVNFKVPDLTDIKRERYLKLFEAVYAGDEATVKSICLDTENPLQIAVVDSANFNPFSLAILRGHYGLAKTVLDIAAAQYQPPKEDLKTYKHSLHRFDEDDGYYSDEDSVKSDDDVQVYSKLIDENYAIDDIRSLSDNVKSKISPAQLFSWGCGLWRTMSMAEPEAKAMYEPEEPSRVYGWYYEDEDTPIAWFREMKSRETARNNYHLFRYAIINNDMKMLRHLLVWQKDLLYKKDDGATLQELQMAKGDFEQALRIGNTEIIGEIIRSTGTMLPLANLAEKAGAQIDHAPEYYQGLSVYGKKRTDWAEKERGHTVQRNSNLGSPFLMAIMSGNIKTVEYFLSETPLRCYEEFTKAFEHDKHIELLARSEGGIERALHSWMNTRSNLAVHMAVMADPKSSKAVRGFIVKRMPQFIDVKSKDGTSPLQLAFELQNYNAAKELIAAGADQKHRNKCGENLLHTIYMNRDDLLSAESLHTAIGLLDPNVVPGLTLQRCYGDGTNAQTPLMRFLGNNKLTGKDEKILEAMLDYSDDKDLEIIDAAGDFPIHSLVRSKTAIDDNIKYLARRRPDLLSKENATGQTPLEILENKFFRAMMDSPPRINVNMNATTPNLAQVSASSFIDPKQFEHQGFRYLPRYFYDDLKEIADQHPQQRKLVSLLDANETARRVAEQQKKATEEMKQREALGYKSYHSRRYRRYRNDGDEDNQDEVSWWKGAAQSRRKMAIQNHKGTATRQHGGWAPRKLLGT